MESSNFADTIIKATIQEIQSAAYRTFYPFRFYLLGLLILVIGGILVQVFMKRTNPNYSLSSGFNKMVGSLIYSIFSILITFIAYSVLGSQVIDTVWLGIIGAISFVLTGAFLRLTGFWR